MLKTESHAMYWSLIFNIRPTLAAFLALLTGWTAKSQVVMVTKRQMLSQYMTHNI